MNISDVTYNSISKTEATSFYKVPLECTAATEIGCGSRTKPVLLELEKQKKAVDGAWLNRTGTVIAVVWKSDASKELRKDIVERVFHENNIPVTKADGEEHRELLDDFRSGSPWYRGRQVDKLSTKEAEIIAERLVDRVSNKTSLPVDKQQILMEAFSPPLKEELTQTFSSAINTDEEAVFKPILKRINKRLLDIGRLHLNRDQLAVLNEALKDKKWYLDRGGSPEDCEANETLKQRHRSTQKEDKTNGTACSCCDSSNE